MSWSDKVKAAFKRKEVAWEEVLGARDEDAKERCMGAYKKEKRKVKRCQSKKEIQEQFGREINHDVNGNGKLFWKEVSNVNGGWHWKILKCKGFGRSILRIFII